MSEALEQSGLREGYKQVQFGPKTLVVPSDWSTERFGDVYDRRRESIDDLKDEPVKYVGLKHLDSGQITINGFDEDGRERSSSRIFREGDVLFGKLRPNLNKAAIAPFSGVCSSDIIPIYAEKDARQQYLPYLMHSKLVRDRVVSTMEGTNLPRTSWGDLEKTLIPLPPLLEQHRIAEILSTVDEQIQQTDELIEKTKELKRGVTQDLMSTGINHDSYAEQRIGPIEVRVPANWDVRSLSDICTEVRNGFVGSATQYYTDDEDAIPYLQSNNVRRNKIDTNKLVRISKKFDQENPGTRVYTGNLLTVQSGHIGETCIVPERFDGANSHAIIISRLETEIASPKFVSHWLNSTMGKKVINAITVGSTVKHINVTDFRKIEIPLPEINEQRKIGNILTKLGDMSDEERARKSKLKQIKRGLIQDLLTGKVRVNTD